MSLPRRTAASVTAAALALAAAVSAPPASAAVQKWTDAHTRSPVRATSARAASLHSVAMPRVSRFGSAKEAMIGKTIKPSYATQASATRTKTFGLVGVTWARDTGMGEVTVQVRTRTAGSWSSWTTLGADGNDDAGPGTRQGSDPLWVGKADGVAARVRSSTGTPPRDVRIDLIDPGADPAGSRSATATQDRATGTSRTLATAAASVTPRASGNPTYLAEPSVISRASWGAKKSTSCDSPQVAQKTLGIVVHHTAGSNSYQKSSSMAIVRGIQKFHMSGRGWCDIGYNYLVDKYGQIFEGRGGEVSKYQVRAAHAGNFTVNTYALGVSMMGNLDKTKPSSSMRSAMYRLISWRMATRYLPATGTYPIAGRKLDRISGHRDVRLNGIRPATATACPGKYGVPFLSTLRSVVKDRIATYNTPIEQRYRSLTEKVTGPVYVGERPAAAGWRTKFDNGDILYKNSTTGAHFVTGPVLKTLTGVGSVSGSYGFPTSDLVTSGALQRQEFEGGAIYQTSTTTAYALTSEIDTAYRSHSELGAPRSSATTKGTVTTATFENGTITYDSSTDTTTVS